MGVLRTLRGTMGHSVADLLASVRCPCLFIWGAEDRVIADVPGAIRAASRIDSVHQVVIPHCGHAPQIEKSRLVNTLIHRFLRNRLGPVPSSLSADRFLREWEAAR
jgi:pimeloyl-ACP methyl ester carboxylesterase